MRTLLSPRFFTVCILALSSICVANAQDAVTISGTTVAAASATLPAFGSTSSACELTVIGAEPYVDYTLLVDANGSYELSVVEPVDLEGSTDDTMFFVYSGLFDSQDACSNLLAIGNEAPGSGLSVVLDASKSYTLLVAGFFGSEDPYMFNIAGPAGSNISLGELPIELASFSSLVEGKTIVLNWSVLSESNNRGFEVQQELVPSLESVASEWIPIGFVESVAQTSGAQSYVYAVNDVEIGTYRFRLKQVDLDGTATYTSAVETIVQLDTPFLISDVYPNPSMAGAQFSIAVAVEQKVVVSAFDMLGRRVAVLLDKTIPNDQTTVVGFDASVLPIGVLHVVVDGEHFRETRRLVVVR